MIQAQRRRLSSTYSQQEALDLVIPVLNDIEHVATQLCGALDTWLGFDSVAGAGENDAITLLCDHFLRRVDQSRLVFMSLRDSEGLGRRGALDDAAAIHVVSRLSTVAALMNMSAEAGVEAEPRRGNDSLVELACLVRKSWFGPHQRPQHEPRLQTCRPCDYAQERLCHTPEARAGNGAGAGVEAELESKSPAISSYLHFACSPDFLYLDGVNNTTAFLLSWASSQLALRFAILEAPTLDVDGEPLFPNNQHPFTEADDVVDLNLEFESDTFALVRYLVEFAATVDELLSRLSTNTVLAGSDPEAVAAIVSSRSMSASTPQPRWWSFGSRSTRRTREEISRELVVDVAAAAMELASLRNNSLLSAIQALGLVATSVAAACSSFLNLSAALDDIDAGRYRLNFTSAAVKQTSSPQQDVDIEISHVSLKGDAGVYAASLQAEYDAMTAALRERRRERRRKEYPETRPSELRPDLDEKSRCRSSTIRTPKNEALFRELEGFFANKNLEGLMAIFQSPKRPSAVPNVDDENEREGVDHIIAING
ncbi:uncharacterized protein CTRU02_215791 [Colletotrichum truncatum]|uniref:Uncharacterized protein n=1 Tax=Colletotrichum truncatum TaxID=5467 RepID=A0ACC3YBQ6_COLTU